MPGASEQPGPWGEGPLVVDNSAWSRAHRIPLVDYLLGAAAQHTASAVLHYDHDFDILARLMGFESIWLAPAGSIP
jgi:hypothetical protein